MVKKEGMITWMHAICEYIICSKSLQAMLASEMGRPFEGSERLPDLNAVNTLLIFQSFGSKLCVMDSVKSICNTKLQNTFVPFSILAVLPSCAGSTNIFIFAMSFKIPPGVIVMRGIWGRECMADQSRLA